MKRNNSYLAATMIIVSFLWFYACEKSNKDEKISGYENAIDTDEELVVVSNDLNEIIAIVDEQEQVVTSVDDVVYEESAEELEFDLIEEVLIDELFDEMFKSTDGNTCPSTNVQFLNEGARYPRVITNTYSDSCTNKWGEQKTGTIIITDSDNPRNEGAKREVRYESLTVKNMTLNGVKEIVNEGINENGEYVLKYKGAIRVEKPNGIIVYRIINEKKFRLDIKDEKGMITEILWRISGQVYAVKSSGIAFKMKIDENALITKSSTCKWPVSGTKIFTFFNNPEEIEAQIELYKEDFGMNDLKILQFKKDYNVTINFGDENSTCDNLAIKTVDNGEPVEITIKR